MVDGCGHPLSTVRRRHDISVVSTVSIHCAPGHSKRHRRRARGQSLGSLTHWVFAFITTYAFPVLTDKLGGGYAFGIFFLAMVGQLFWVLKVMPETKGIPLEDMEEKLGLTND